MSNYYNEDRYKKGLQWHYPYSVYDKLFNDLFVVIGKHLGMFGNRRRN